MTVCAAYRDRLLEADVAELEGTGPSALAEHVRSCPDCATAASGILKGQRDLARLLEERAEGVAADFQVRSVRVEEARRPLVLRPLRVFVPLAAAAVLAVALFTGTGERSPAEISLAPAWALPAGAMGESRPVASAGAHERVAVLPTRNPDITVVWFMD